MKKCAYELRPPASPEEWKTYHRIRREVLFEADRQSIQMAKELSRKSG